MDNHLSVVNATKDDSEIGGIQDAEEEDLHCLDNKRFAFSENESGLVTNHPSPSSAIIISSSPKEFPEVEELYAISQGGRTIRKEVGIAVSTTKVPFTSTAVTTRSSRGVKPRKSNAQLALESQERFERARKSEKQARKEVAQDKNRAKRLEPRKERVSQLLDDFPELLDDEES